MSQNYENDLQEAQDALASGNLLRARLLFAQIVQQEPQSVRGWMGLGSSQIDHQKKAQCFLKVLEINPENIEARNQLMELGYASIVLAGEEKRIPEQLLPEETNLSDGLQGLEANKENPKQLDENHNTSNQKENQFPLLMIGIISGFIALGIPLGYLIWSLQAASNFNQPIYITATISHLATASPGLISSVPSSDLVAVPKGTATPEVQTPPPLTTNTPTISAPIPSVSPSLSYVDQFQDSYPMILAAQNLMDAEKYAEAVLAWDKIIELLPDYSYAYYKRSQCYLETVFNGQRYYSETYDYTIMAFEDIDKAIELDSGTGDYYWQRYAVQQTLGDLEPYREQRNDWYELALDDIFEANRLGTSEEYADRYPGWVLVWLERCQEALDFFGQLMAEAQDGQLSAGLNKGISQSFMCFGEYEKAIIHHRLGYQISSTHKDPDREFKNILLLYNLGREDQALAALDYSIREDPYYRGNRYYLRALIHYDRGDYDKALNDIEFGSGQIWGQAGLASYVLGLLAIREGDLAYGKELLEYAEATLDSTFGPDLRNRIRRDLGLPEIDPGVPIIPSVVVPILTSTPVVVATSTPRPTPEFDHQVAYATLHLAVPYEGTGPFTLNPQNDGIIFRFKPIVPITFEKIHSLEFFLVLQDSETIPNLTLYGFKYINPNEIWVSQNITLVSGINNYNLSESLISQYGDIYIKLVNEGSQPVAVNNLGLKLVVQNSDGTKSTYGVEFPDQ